MNGNRREIYTVSSEYLQFFQIRSGFSPCIFMKNMLRYTLTAQYPSQSSLFQAGPKNPVKGISMKSLVSACYAQFRVDAGG